MRLNGAAACASLAADARRTSRPTRASRSSAACAVRRRSAGAELLEHGAGVLHVLVLFALFLVTNALNFLLIAVDVAVVDGQGDPGRASATSTRPCCPSSSRSACSRAGVAFAYQAENLAVIGPCSRSSCSSSSTCCGPRCSSMERKEQLEGRTRQLASLQVGLLGTVLQTLSLRDKMTARHSAAVARYSREIARELGLSRPRAGRRPHRRAAARHREVHLPGLDPVRRLEAQQGGLRDRARGIRSRARGSSRGSTATARSPRSSSPTTSAIDGNGLPERPRRRADPARGPDHLGRGHLRRDDVARLLPPARLVARGDRGAAARVGRAARRATWSRRSSRLLERRSVTFRHADDADFERELNLERRVADYAAPRRMAGLDGRRLDHSRPRNRTDTGA